MIKMHKLAFLTLLSILVAGCHRHSTAPPEAKAAQKGHPARTTLWSGQTLEGPIEVKPDGSTVVAGRPVPESDISSVEFAGTADKGGAPAIDVLTLPAGYGPLTDAELAAFRARAEAAAAAYPGSEAIFCLDKAENIYNSDGSKVYRYHAMYLVLKESARGTGDVSVYYQDGRERAVIYFIRTIAPSGAVELATNESFLVAVPPQDAQFVDTRGRTLSGKAPQITPGCLVEYAYEQVEYNPEVKEFFFPGYYFQSNYPVLDSTIDVLVPKGTFLNFTTARMPAPAAAPAKSERGGFDVYSWGMHDLEPMVDEPFMPYRSDVVPSMEASLYSDWKKLMAVTGAFQRERMEPSAEVTKLAGELIAGKTTDDEKVAVLYTWVQRNINYLSVKASLSSGWAGHPASDTLKNGYGDCTDVSILLASLCRAVGVDAYPAIVRTNDHGQMTTDIPVPNANHAITLVYPNGQPRFLDATAQDYRYPYFRDDDHGIKAVIHLREEIMDVPVPAPEDNMRESRQEVNLFADGSAAIKERNAYTGPYEAGVRGYWRSVPPELRGQVMAQYLQRRVPGAALESFDLGDLENLDRQIEMAIDYKLPVIASRTKDLYIFSLPNFAQEFPEAALDSRKYDVSFPTTQCFATEVTIFLPDGYDFTGTREDLSLKTPYLSFEGTTRLSDDKRALVVKQVLKRLTNKVPVADYGAYRKTCTDIATWTDLKIVLRQTTDSSAKETQQ